MKPLAIPWLLLLFLATATTAHAAEPSAEDACPSPRTLKKCGELGERYYESGQYPLAIQAFRQAYVLQPLPIFLYDMAQAHRLAGQTDEAIQLYERYLREDPNSDQKTEVEGFLKQLHLKQEQDQQEAAARLRLLTLQSQQAALTAASPPPPKPLYKRWWLWTTVGVVAAGAIITGAVVATRPGEVTLQPINAR